MAGYSFDAMKAEVSEIVYQGFPMSAILSQLHDDVVRKSELTDLDKALICEKIAEVFYFIKELSLIATDVLIGWSGGSVFGGRIMWGGAAAGCGGLCHEETHQIQRCCRCDVRIESLNGLMSLHCWVGAWDDSQQEKMTSTHLFYLLR